VIIHMTPNGHSLSYFKVMFFITSVCVKTLILEALYLKFNVLEVRLQSFDYVIHILHEVFSV
jgi:hypothetical protein